MMKQFHCDDSGRISLPHNFCDLGTSQDELVKKIFFNVQTKNIQNKNNILIFKIRIKID